MVQDLEELGPKQFTNNLKNCYLQDIKPYHHSYHSTILWADPQSWYMHQRHHAIVYLLFIWSKISCTCQQSLHVWRPPFWKWPGCTKIGGNCRVIPKQRVSAKLLQFYYLMSRNLVLGMEQLLPLCHFLPYTSSSTTGEFHISQKNQDHCQI